MENRKCLVYDCIKVFSSG